MTGERASSLRRGSARTWAGALGGLVIALSGASLAGLLLGEGSGLVEAASLAAPIEIATPDPSARASAPPLAARLPAVEPAAGRPAGELPAAEPATADSRSVPRPALPAEALKEPGAFAVSGEVLGTELALGPIQIEAVATDPASRAASLLRGGVFSLALPRGGAWRVRATSSQASSPWSLVTVSPRGRVRLSLAAPVRVEGRCFGPGGEALRGVQVTLQDVAGNSTGVSSDAEGGFGVRVTPGQELLIQGSHPGLASALVRLDPSELVEGLELHLEALHEVVAGRFLGPSGRPLRGALSFDARAADPHAHASERVSFEAELDGEGRPQLAGLPGGVWTVSLPEPASDELRAWVREIDTAEEAAPVLELTPAPRGQLAGRVLGAPFAESVQVELRPESLRGGFHFLAARRPDARGAFEFPAVPVGVYRVFATWEGGTTRFARVEVLAGDRAWASLEPALPPRAPR